jgi:16S rRNA (cytidine1402-2'-O)-methyltransferase
MTAHGGREGGSGGLYVVATPIGNLDDITFRAVAVLRAADVVFAEDTRTTQHLLAHHGIRARLKSLHEHNEAVAGEAVIAALDAGETVAIVSDAGTPGISDPGASVVARVLEAGHRVVPVPGASALTAAMSASGVAGPFAFLGFLPAKPSQRRKMIEAWRTFGHAMVLYEAPHRIVECVDDLASVLGEARRVVIARELTKLFESIHACALGEARAWLEGDANRQRGEFVLVVAGAPAAADADAASRDRVLRALLAELPLSQAVKLAAEITGGRRNELYDRALELDRESARDT